VCGTGDLRFSPLLNSDEGQSLNNLLFLGRYDSRLSAHVDCGLAPSKHSPIHASPICLLSLFTSNSLHFAPDSAATQSLVAHLSATSSSFANLTTSTHVDEASAVQSMLAQETRAWALIVLHSVERGNVDFTLRLNYSAIPSTYDLVGRHLWWRQSLCGCVLCVHAWWWAQSTGGPILVCTS
jgi:hypothetical protein